MDALRLQLTTAQSDLSRRNEELAELHRIQAAGPTPSGPHPDTLAGQQVSVILVCYQEMPSLLGHTYTQISELRSHRLIVEQSIAQQTTLVQKLEDRLRETETAIQQHLTGIAAAPSRKQQVDNSPPQSPKSRRHEQHKQARAPSDHSSDEVPRLRTSYKPTPKPSEAKSRLRWDDVHGDSDYDIGDRLLDLTYEEGEVSDEEDWRGFYRRSSSSSDRAVSMLRDVLLHLISREERGGSKSSRRKVAVLLLEMSLSEVTMNVLYVVC